MLVRLLLALITSALAAPALAAPDAIVPGEQIDFAIEYLHIKTGQARISLGKAEGSIWPVVMQGRTEGITGMLDIREHVVSYWDSEQRLPRGSDSNSIEVGDRHSDRARFDRRAGKVLLETHRPGKLLERSFDVPTGAQDMAGALLFVRLQPLAPGSRLQIPVFASGQSFTLAAEVVGREKIETPAGTWNTLRVQLHSAMQGNFRSCEMVLWVSDDARHVPVRVSADFAI